MFIGYQLNGEFFRKFRIYDIYDTTDLDITNQKCIEIILQFIQYLSKITSKCLKKMINKVKIFKNIQFYSLVLHKIIFLNS